MEFRLGDVVQLNSGGPSMTVTTIRESNLEVCWFCKRQKEVGNFPKEALKAIAQKIITDEGEQS